MKPQHLVLFLLLFISTFSFAKKPTVFEHFYQDENIHITIETDMKKLNQNKHSAEWWAGKLTWKNKEGVFEDLNIELRTRGNLRRQICYYAPVKIKISKEDKSRMGLSGSRKIKIVSTCKATKSMEEYVLREHLIYKMYNKLTDASFRVQLVHFTFKGNDGKAEKRESYGYLIEDISDVAKRIDEKELEPTIMSYKALSDAAFDRMSIFQYAIANTDWYISNQHNMKLVSDKTNNMAIAIPYDFDFAGLVKTDYSVPSPGIPTPSVLVRTYIGECRTDEEWKTNLAPFHAIKNDWISLIENDEFLSEKSKNRMSKFLLKFYKIIESEKKVKSRLKKECGKYIRRGL